MNNVYGINDIDLNAEMLKIINGEDGMFRGQRIVLQSLILDSNDKPIKASTSYKLTGEGKARNREPGTTRTGYYCNEYLINGFFAPSSLMRTDEKTTPMGGLASARNVIYFTSEITPKIHDVIVFVKMDAKGEIINPVTAERELYLAYVHSRRLDNSQLEYHVCVVEDQK